MPQEINTYLAGRLLDSALRLPNYKQIGNELPIRRPNDYSLIYTRSCDPEMFSRLCGKVYENMYSRTKPTGPLRPMFDRAKGKELILGLHAIRPFVASRLNSGLPPRSVMFGRPLTEFCTPGAIAVASWLEEVLLPHFHKHARQLSTELLCVSKMELISDESENPLAMMHRHDLNSLTNTRLEIDCLVADNGGYAAHIVNGRFVLEDGRQTVYTQANITNFYDIVLALTEMSVDVVRAFTDSGYISREFSYVGFIELSRFSNQLMNLVDWLINNQDRIPRVRTKLGYVQALNEARKWHENRFERESRAREKRLRNQSKGQRTLVCQFSVPQKESVTYNVFALEDRESLEYETVLQRHCVETYWTRVLVCTCRIFHLEGNNGERWTVETDYPIMKAVQVRGPCNKQSDPLLFFSINQDLLPTLRVFYERTDKPVATVPQSSSSFSLISRAQR